MKITKELLIELHYNQNMCIKQLMVYFGKSESAIGWNLKKFGIKVIREKQPEEDLTNKTFGKLTVLRKSDRIYKDGHSRWVCICDCGSDKEKHITPYHIINQTIKSCGCAMKGRFGPNPKIGPKIYKGYEDLSATYWGVITHGAKIRHLEFSITMKDAWKQYIKQTGICSLSGESIILDKKYGTNAKPWAKEPLKQTASLDRIDSSKGYTVDNIQWIHKALNPMKMDMSEDNFVAWCKKVAMFKDN